MLKKLLELVFGTPSKYFGVLAEFSNPKEVFHAAEKIRAAGYKKWDVHSPFPIHGMQKAMGLKDSPLGWISLLHPFGGVFGGFALQYWIHRFAYPIMLSGKPLVAYPAYLPICFGLGILLTCVGTLMGMLALNGLPRLYHAVFRSERFKKFSDDGFFVTIEARDPKFDLEKTKAFLQSLGGKHIELLDD